MTAKLPILRTYTPARLLSGFMDGEHLAGFARSAGIEAARQAELHPQVLASRLAASQLTVVDFSDVIVREIKDPHVDRICDSHLFKDSFPTGTHVFAWVRPNALVAQQVHVREREVVVPERENDLLEYGLPTDWSVPVETYQAGPGVFHMTSSSPLFTGITASIDDDGRVVFEPRKHVNLIQVVHFAGRFYARNGHNRIFYAVRAGRPEIPALVRYASDAADVALPVSPFAFNFAHSQSLSRPPLVADHVGPSSIELAMRVHRPSFVVKVEVLPLVVPV